jgi:tRNA pseudouridine38-40 synthase
VRAFRLAYDGTPFHGFQRQPDVPSVEDALFEALAGLDLHDPADPKPAGYSAAGRTDAGVSALAQTVAFEAPAWCSPSALNGELPPAIRAWASADVPSDFHATRDARRRTYRYYLHAPRSPEGILGPTGAVDDDRLRDAAARLSGEHDFRNLTPDDGSTVRAVSIDVERDGAFLVLAVSAGGFPRQLVRRLVTLLSEVGTGERAPDSVERVLDDEPLPGEEGVQPAPAYPLVLAAVEYDLDFEVDPDAAEAARAVFESSRAEHLTRSRVAGSIVDGL